MNQILFYNWCAGCNNHKKSLKGPICKLTQGHPTFTDNCADYSANNEKLIKSQQWLVENNHADDRYFEEIRPTYLIRKVKDLPDELILKNKKFDFNFLYLLFLDLFGAIFFNYILNNTLNPISFSFLKIFVLLFIFSIPIYAFMTASMMDQSDKITLSKKGIKIENKGLIKWENTFTYIMIKYANSDGPSSWKRHKYLVIKIPFKKEKMIFINNLEKTQTELSNLIENYKT